MRKQGSPRSGRSQHRRIGQRGNLIPKIRSRHNGSCRPAGIEPLGNPMPINATPMVAMVVHELPVMDRYQRAYHARRRKKHRRINDFQAVTNQGGTMPLTIHVPAYRAIRNRIRIADPTARMLSKMHVSSLFHEAL